MGLWLFLHQSQLQALEFGLTSLARWFCLRLFSFPDKTNLTSLPCKRDGRNKDPWLAAIVVKHMTESQDTFDRSRGVDRVRVGTSHGPHWPDEVVVPAELDHLPSYPAPM